MMGLRELRARSKPGECPFCGEPCERKRTPAERRAKNRAYNARVGLVRSRNSITESEFRATCGDAVCVVAYQRFWKRDRRAGLPLLRAALALAAALVLVFTGCGPCDAFDPTCAPVWPPEVKTGEPCPRAGLIACDGDCQVACLVDGGVWDLESCTPRCRGRSGIGVGVVDGGAP